MRDVIPSPMKPLEYITLLRRDKRCQEPSVQASSMAVKATKV